MKQREHPVVARVIGLILVSVFAIAIMLASGTKWLNTRTRPAGSSDEPVQNPLDVPAPVLVKRLEREPVEIIDRYPGMIRPLERYNLAFEIGGRIKSLGETREGKSLDEGDRVQVGQVLAILDERLLIARRDEATARLERAQDEMQRAQELRGRGNTSITEAEFQRRITELTIAKSIVAVAEKSLEDARLVAPCDGVISRRFINAGESVNPNQNAFEIVQVDQVLLAVGVPESRIQEIHGRRRQILQNCRQATIETSANPGLPDPERFKVYVELLSTDRFNRPWPTREGEVYRISETADDRTGLFEVEVLLDNADGVLKPGLVAEARLVIDQIVGFRLPIRSALIRGGQTSIFVIEGTETNIPFMFWNLGAGEDFRARAMKLTEWIEQESDLIIPNLPGENVTIVVRGQHRLVDGRRVRIVGTEDDAEDVVTLPGDAELMPANP